MADIFDKISGGDIFDRLAPPPPPISTLAEYKQKFIDAAKSAFAEPENSVYGRGATVTDLKDLIAVPVKTAMGVAEGVTLGAAKPLVDKANESMKTLGVTPSLADNRLFETAGSLAGMVAPWTAVSKAMPVISGVSNAATAGRVINQAATGGAIGGAYSQNLGEDAVTGAVAGAALAGTVQGAIELPSAIRKSTWFRKMTIPERNLVVQSAEEMRAGLKAQGWNDGQINAKIARTNKAEFDEMVKTRMATEKPLTPPIAEPTPAGEMPVQGNLVSAPPEPAPVATSGGIPKISAEDAQVAKQQVVADLATMKPDDPMLPAREIQLEQYNQIIGGDAKYSDFQPAKPDIFDTLPNGKIVPPEMVQDVKQPWEMTREEYVNNSQYPEADKDYDQALNTARMEGTITQQEFDSKALRDSRGVKYLWAKTRNEIASEGKANVKNAKMSRAELSKLKGDPKNFAKWRINSMKTSANKDIVAAAQYAQGLLDVHKERVLEAIAEGKPIPAEVLADYPDLVNTSSAETTRQSAAQILNENPEGVPSIGLSTGKALPINDNVIIPHSVDPEVTRRWKAAHGLTQATMADKAKDFIERLKKGTRHYPELRPEDAQAADILRQYEASGEAAKIKTVEYIRSLTHGFGKNKMHIFERKIILDDLMNELEKGRSLPFGYTPETLAKDHAQVSQIADANPDIKAAIERRKAVQTALVDEAIDAGLLPKTINNDGTYFRHMVLEYANLKQWSGLGTSDVRNRKRGWQKSREGSLLDINTKFIEAEFEQFSQLQKELATKRTLDKIIQTAAIPMPKDGVIPEGYVEWQPHKGNVFFQENTLPERLLDKAIGEGWDVEQLVESGLIRQAIVMGGKKKSYILPEGVAHTLENIRLGRDTAVLDSVNKKMIAAWKVWTLLSPRRFIKYNLNNMSGDMDAAIAADPAIMKYLPQAYRNALNRNAGRALSSDEVDMIDRGVISSGISLHEIGDIGDLPGFHKLSLAHQEEKLLTAMRSGDFSGLIPNNLIQKYFGVISNLTNMREGLLREAAYLRATELLGQNKPIYWASDPKELDSIPDNKDKAAKLSRELIGDYGNLSAHGEFIRGRYLPFWSWMEINAPRYYRIFKNAATQGEGGGTAARIAGVGAKKAAGAALNLTEKLFLTQLLFMSVSAFNHFVHPDEEENMNQKQLHLILGKNSKGNTMSVRFQGAFSDALSWFGLEDYPETIAKMKSGKMETQDLMKKMIIATPNKIINALTPYTKLAFEVATGKSLYPDVSRPTQIRDKAEHVARFLSLENEYRVLMGKPTKGYGDSLKNVILYESNPGEQAYNEIRKMTYDFMEKKDKGYSGAEPTARANALYYYKQSLRYGDKEGAKKYLDEYIAKGGSGKGLSASIRNAFPLSATGKYTGEFVSKLSKEDKAKLDLAIKWYQDVYTTKHGGNQ